MPIAGCSTGWRRWPASCVEAAVLLVCIMEGHSSPPTLEASGLPSPSFLTLSDVSDALQASRRCLAERAGAIWSVSCVGLVMTDLVRLGLVVTHPSGVHKCPPSGLPGHHFSVLSPFSFPWVQHLLIPSHPACPRAAAATMAGKALILLSALCALVAFAVADTGDATAYSGELRCEGMGGLREPPGLLRGAMAPRDVRLHPCSSALPGRLALPLLPIAAGLQ